jgi:hypothetical protein
MHLMVLWVDEVVKIEAARYFAKDAKGKARILIGGVRSVGSNRL